MEKHELEALEFEIKGLLDELSNEKGDQEVIHLMEEWLYTRMGHVYKINPIYDYSRRKQ
jgi:hypothetical protein